MRQTLQRIALVLAVVVSIATPALAQDDPPELPSYSGNEFRDLFDRTALPGTQPIASPPFITGNAAADARIRSIGEGRGYKLRSTPTVPLGSAGGLPLHPDGAQAWRELAAEASEQGHALVVTSAFRSVDTQRALFLARLTDLSIADIASGAADAALDRRMASAAPPGYSKHHTGYALDVTQAGTSIFSFHTTPGYAWLAADNFAHAKRFGFLPSYPFDATFQGPDPEPWELVYVGVDTIRCGTTPLLTSGSTDSGRPTAPPSSFVPTQPTRVLDTRTTAPLTRPCAGSVIDLPIIGQAGVLADATAVVLNVTITDARRPGFVTVWPTGSDRPLASNLNVVEPDTTVANQVTVALGEGGMVSLANQPGGHLVADVAGYFAPPIGRGGRFVPVSPTRLFDTRTADAPTGPLFPESTLTVNVADLGGVEPADLAAVVMTITAVDSAEPGFVTVWPGGTGRPLASNLNVDGSGAAVPNLVIVPIGVDGTISFFSQSSSHLLADLTGYFTSPAVESDPTVTAGLFVPIVPQRLFDTRTSTAGILPAGTTIDTTVSSAVPDAGDAIAVALNVTGTEAPTGGFVTVWPTDAEQPTASSLNLRDREDTRAAAAMIAVGGDGTISFFSQQGGHLLADASGYFTG